MEFHLLFKKLRSLDLTLGTYLAMNKTALGELDEIFYLLFMRRLKDNTYILIYFIQSNKLMKFSNLILPSL